MSNSESFLRASVLAVSFCLFSSARADQVSLGPSTDSSIFENSATGSETACGSGPLFAGQTGAFGLRRALMRFDVAAAIPAGATIDDVDLALYVSQSGPFSTASDVFSLHRVTADWGEGASVCQIGDGVPPELGDATWSYRFYQTSTWGTPGGDFVSTASGTTAMPLLGTVTFSSTSQMVADVQGWLDAPAANDGWILLGKESADRTARRILSREEEDEFANGPVLHVRFSPPVTPPAVPDGQTGSPLRLGKTGPANQDLVVTWDVGSCTGAADHHLVYGTRSGFPAVLGGTYTLQGGVCDLGTAPPYTWVGSPDPAALDPASRLLFILVLADDNGTTEGSWGHASLGLERNGPGTHGASNRCGAVDKDLSNTCGNAP